MSSFTVKDGDNLKKIAKVYFADRRRYQEITRQGQPIQNNQISVGNILNLPIASTHIRHYAERTRNRDYATSITVFSIDYD